MSYRDNAEWQRLQKVFIDPGPGNSAYRMVASMEAARQMAVIERAYEQQAESV